MKKLAIITLVISSIFCGCASRTAGNNLGTAVDRYDQYYTTNGYRYNDGYIYDNGYGYTNASGTRYGDDSGFGGVNSADTVSGGYIGRGIAGKYYDNSVSVPAASR
ncbi:MAG: hypothetical protein IKU80_05505 [Firmicutes bacterium]|nr:hypothetical protein [Bacillota bacterium]